MTTMIDNSDFSTLLDLVMERVERWGEELYEQGWRGTIGLLLEGEPNDEWISPLIGGSINLERGEEHTPEPYEVEDRFRYGTDDPDYPINQVNELLMTYTGTDPYWYNLGLRIHPEEGVRLSVIG